MENEIKVVEECQIDEFDQKSDKMEIIHEHKISSPGQFLRDVK